MMTEETMNDETRPQPGDDVDDIHDDADADKVPDAGQPTDAGHERAVLRNRGLSDEDIDAVLHYMRERRVNVSGPARHKILRNLQTPTPDRSTSMARRRPTTWTHQGCDLLDEQGRWRGTLCDEITAQEAAVALTQWFRWSCPGLMEGELLSRSSLYRPRGGY
jgi:hypothetical protein